MAVMANAAPVTVKFATVAPEGSMWTDVLKEINSDIKTRTGGRVEFKIYPGGIAGDEPDVLRKMRVGQYHGAGFTGVGLGEVLGKTRILELPFMFRSLQELDYVKSRITPEIEAGLKEKGFVFLGWAEPGLVYIFAQKPIHGPADMNGVKMWGWEADPLAAAIFKAFKVTPVHIALPDVLMGLQTGMLNAVYGPPLAAMALQWHTKVKFMMSEPLTNSTGGVLVSKKTWDRMQPQDQAVVKSAFLTGLDKLTAVTRKQNNEAIARFKQFGIKIVSITKTDIEEMIKVASIVRPQLVGKLYSADLLKRVEGWLAEKRLAE
ncbi:MAG: hypothetical protein A2583_01600 [Bdellovibrionales bacterium RIFOXYD1_FULL_53_11]|nr:MAG: hypothetical protein A2583_01600 [Bdellovibrionales bacterium RIFOXYD1_FULL_53_11]